MQKPERRIVITIFVNPVLAAKEDSVRDKAEGIGGDILPVLVRGEREVVALLLPGEYSARWKAALLSERFV